MCGIRGIVQIVKETTQSESARPQTLLSLIIQNAAIPRVIGGHFQIGQYGGYISSLGLNTEQIKDVFYLVCGVDCNQLA